MQSLEEEYKTCSRCPELQEKIQVVFGSGNKNADILFIGEAPGANEDKQGIPFCGASGQVLNQLLSDTDNIIKTEVLINAVNKLMILY